MAQIDPSIALNIRPVQLESPINAMSAIAQMQGAQQQQQMNALKLREAQQLEKERNELAKIMSGNLPFGSEAFMREVLSRAPSQYEGIATRALQREDIKERAAKRELDIKKLSADQFRDSVSELASFDKVDQVLSSLEQKVESGEITETQKRQVIATLPDNDSEMPAWQLRTIRGLLPPEKRLEAAKPVVVGDRLIDPLTGKALYEAPTKPVVVADRLVRPDTGEVVYEAPVKPVVVADRLVRPDTGEVVYEAPAKLTESPLARLERERAELAAKNPNDPRIKQYDEAIEKEIGVAKPEIVREYEYAVKNGQFKGTLLQFKEAFARAGRPVSTTINQPAPTVTMVLDPADPTRLLLINAREYRGGSLGSPGVIGIAGKEPTAGKRQEAKEVSQANAGQIIAQLRQSYDQLDRLGGITSTSNLPGTNILAGLSSSAAGQFTGRLLGTEAQSERNKITQTRPLLMTTIMQAMGLSAKQLDSNAELKLWLSSATDPTLDLEANRTALNNLERMLTSKPATAASTTAAPTPTTPPPKPPTVGTVKDGYKFKGGNPADKNNWEKVK